jgi:hypothetical protein
MLSDRRIAGLMAATTAHGTGIGGRSAELDVDGRRVFVKRVPLTDLETRLRSTVNVRHWEGSGAVRGRLEAIGRSTLSLVLFLEHIPHRLSAWLADGRDVARHAWAERQLNRGADLMSSQGLVHFDAISTTS